MDNLDFSRGVQAFLSGLPGSSLVGMRAGLGQLGANNNTVAIFENLIGPTAPAGHEANWVQTIPGKGWNVLLRHYGPLQPWYDKTWRPGEIELTK
jgi:hypothetical protein